MSVRVCYVQRSSGGDTISGVRLVGERSDETWSAPEATPEAGGPLDADAAADWIQSRLARAAGRAVVDLICLDADGSACSWVSAPSADPEVVASLTRQGGSMGDHDGPSRPGSPLAAYCASPDEASVALLGEPPASASPAAASLRSRFSRKTPATADGAPQLLRIPVMAVTDISARLLMDALDQRRVTVGGVTSIWHAMVAAWDQARPAAESAAAPQLTAVVLIDPAGRLLWSWSRGGVLLAGGSMRLAVERPPAPEPATSGEITVQPGGTWAGRSAPDTRPTPMFGPAEASRLSAEWLAWAAQLGRAPARIIGVTPPPDPSNLVTGPGPFGEALGRTWPGAAIDLATAPDPLGSTLARLAEHIDDTRDTPGGQPPVATLAALSFRPTAAHRSLLIWSALAMIGLAAAVGVAAYRLRVQAGQTDLEAHRLADRWKGLVSTVNPKLLDKPDQVVMGMDKMIAELEKAAKPKTSGTSVMPIREELATLAMVLGDPEVDLQDIELSGSNVVVQVRTTLEPATALRHALSEIAGSHIASWDEGTAGNITNRNGPSGARVYRFVGRWDPAAAIHLDSGAKP